MHFVYQTNHWVNPGKPNIFGMFLNEIERKQQRYAFREVHFRTDWAFIAVHPQNGTDIWPLLLGVSLEC